MAFVASRAQTLGQIGRVMDTIRRLSDVPRRVAVIAAPKITECLQRQFAQGRDPYGRPWAPLRPSTLAKHGPPPLTDKRTLRAGTLAKPKSGRGISLVTGAAYGYFHQVGFHVGRYPVPARRILPQFGLPAEWSAILKTAAQQATRDVVRGSR